WKILHDRPGRVTGIAGAVLAQPVGRALAQAACGDAVNHTLLDRLTEGPLLADGAMGTMLYAHGRAADACFDALNLQDGRAVQAIHAEYAGAGADILETNTFGANRFKLALHGLESRVREINRAGARLARDAREAAGRDV